MIQEGFIGSEECCVCGDTYSVGFPNEQAATDWMFINVYKICPCCNLQQCKAMGHLEKHGIPEDERICFERTVLSRVAGTYFVQDSDPTREDKCEKQEHCDKCGEMGLDCKYDHHPLDGIADSPNTALRKLANEEDPQTHFEQMMESDDGF